MDELMSKISDILVITSYSIHYTKLYDACLLNFLREKPLVAVMLFFMKECSVITSYSIHYTKLYEVVYYRLLISLLLEK